MSEFVTITMVAVDCCACGQTFQMTDGFVKAAQKDHRWWNCPYCGTRQHWSQESKEERLKRQLRDAERSRDSWHETADYKEKQRRAEKGAKTRIINRIKNGVCPVCKRQFQNLKCHMDSKHPGYGEPKA